MDAKEGLRTLGLVATAFAITSCKNLGEGIGEGAVEGAADEAVEVADEVEDIVDAARD